MPTHHFRLTCAGLLLDDELTELEEEKSDKNWWTPPDTPLTVLKSSVVADGGEVGAARPTLSLNLLTLDRCQHGLIDWEQGTRESHEKTMVALSDLERRVLVVRRHALQVRRESIKKVMR